MERQAAKAASEPRRGSVESAASLFGAFLLEDKGAMLSTNFLLRVGPALPLVRQKGKEAAVWITTILSLPSFKKVGSISLGPFPSVSVLLL